VDIPLDLRDLKVPRSKLCGGHGMCVPSCPKSNEHGACWNHTCLCDEGYHNLNSSKSSTTGSRIANHSSSSSSSHTNNIYCVEIPPPPKEPEVINGWFVFVVVLFGLCIISTSICIYKRQEIKQFALWKFASARLYKSFKPAMDHDENDTIDDRERQPRHGLSQHKDGYEAAEI
jgi:hypothetical protein